jgi:methionine synthase II (cobalamin-independent)
MKIDPKITIEDLVREYPKSVQFLMEKGIRCLICGEPIWGTLEDAAKEKGFSDADIQTLTQELEAYLKEPEK